MEDSERLRKAALWLILSLAAASCMEFYVARIWGAEQSPHFSDLYAPWFGAHELFLHGSNPYTLAVARKIQTEIYGAPVVAAYAGDPSAFAGGFAYPLYATFVLWPSVYLPFHLVQTIFYFVSILVTLGSLPLWLRAFHLHFYRLQLLTLALFTLGSFPALQGIQLQNLSLIAAALLAATLFLLAERHLALAGILLAASTFKPQFTLVLVPWLALWTVSKWRRRQAFAWSFLASMFLLIGSSEWMLPGWISGFLSIVRAYKQYTFGHSLLDLWFTPRAGPFAAAGLILAVLALCWKYRRLETDSPRFLPVLSIMLAATITVIPTLAPHTQLLLLPGVIALHSYRHLLWRTSRFARLVLLAFYLLLAWPWIAATGLTLAAVLLPANALLRWWEVPLYTSPLLPLAILVTLCCLLRIRVWPSDTALDASL
jgi:hypothetical protein